MPNQKIQSMFSKTIVPSFAALLLFSCTKENTGVPPVKSQTTTASHDYYHLTPGSYWVYQVYAIDSANNYVLKAMPDSNYVTGDTLIAGKTYHVLHGTAFNIWATQFLRDSSSWLVDEKGYKFCNFSGTSVLESLQTMPYSPSFTLSVAMLAGTQNLTVPAGSFNCVDAQSTCRAVGSAQPWQVCRYYDQNFSDGTGLIRQTAIYLGSNNRLERRLLRYHLN